MSHMFKLVMELPILRHLPLGGGTLLGLAASGGRACLVSACVEAGADVDGNGVSAMVAAMSLLPLANAAGLQHADAMGAVLDDDDEDDEEDHSSAHEQAAAAAADADADADSGLDDFDASGGSLHPPPSIHIDATSGIDSDDEHAETETAFLTREEIDPLVIATPHHWPPVPTLETSL
jgi:hypothetical protein